MKRIIAVLAVSASLAACTENNYYGTEPKAEQNVVTFSPLATPLVTMRPGETAQNAFVTCVQAGSEFSLSVNTDSPAVTPNGYGWSSNDKSLGCPSNMEGHAVQNTLYGSALGSAKITVIVTVTPPGKDPVVKLLTYGAFVSNDISPKG